MAGWRDIVIAFVIAEELGGARLSEAEIAKKKTQVEGFLSALGKSIVFRLLSAETNRGAQLNLPAARRGAIE